MASQLLKRSIPYTKSLIRQRLLTTSPAATPHRNASWTTLALSATALSASFYALGATYPPPTFTLLFPRIAPAPLDEASPESLAYTQSLESELQKLPIIQSARAAPDAEEWYETRPYTNFPEERRVNNLTAGSLRGPGKLALRPLIRVKRDESEGVGIIHLGRGLCGHDGIVHGGLLATLLDESLARVAISNLPEKVGVTANLSLNYRAPTRADQFVVIRTKLTQAKGRKATVSGRVEDLEGNVLVEATGTFVQPRYAKLLNSATLKQAMGEPEPSSHKPVHLADGEKLRASRN